MKYLRLQNSGRISSPCRQPLKISVCPVCKMQLDKFGIDCFIEFDVGRYDWFFLSIFLFVFKSVIKWLFVRFTRNSARNLSTLNEDLHEFRRYWVNAGVVKWDINNYVVQLHYVFEFWLNSLTDNYRYSTNASHQR